MSNSDPTLFERLAKVEPAKLARLLVELAAQDQTILEQVQLLLASGNTTAIAKAVRSTLRAWKRSPRFIHYQEAFAFGEQLDRLLDSVEDGLLGPDPALALGLLEEFLQSDRWILERVDDSAGCIGTAYRRACQLFARAAAGVASPAANPGPRTVSLDLPGLFKHPLRGPCTNGKYSVNRLDVVSTRNDRRTARLLRIRGSGEVSIAFSIQGWVPLPDR